MANLKLRNFLTLIYAVFADEVLKVTLSTGQDGVVPVSATGCLCVEQEGEQPDLA